VIVGYVGFQGNGKTYCLTRDALRAMAIGLPVVSNYPIVNRQGTASTVVDLSKGLEPLFRFAREHPEGCFAAVTEIGLLMPARMWDSVTTFSYLASVAQTRRHKMHLRWDSQFLDLVDKNIRANTQLVWECKCLWRHPWSRDEGAVLDLDGGKKPRRPLIIRAFAFRPKHVDLADSTKQGKILGRRWMVFRPQVAQAYDTYHMIAAAQEARESGIEVQLRKGPVAEEVGVAEAMAVK
jgi:hypothetical protein